MNTSGHPWGVEIEEVLPWPVVSRVTARKMVQSGFQTLCVFILGSEESAFLDNNEVLSGCGHPLLQMGLNLRISASLSHGCYVNRFRDTAACSGEARTALPSSLRGADKMQEPGPGAAESLCPWVPPHVIITHEAGHTIRGKLMAFCEYLHTQ